MYKSNVINDPVYGFISISDEIIFKLIEHPFFQRLRRIKQLGLTHLIYPGALHTRFHHSLGAMYLMSLAVQTLRLKGREISHQEELALLITILLHDIGHGPFSHALEHAIVSEVNHEDISLIYMNRLNKEFDHQLSKAIEIFKDLCPRKFMHQLVSGQLDVDRLDYMKRDSFFCGVAEGIISDDRILKMLNVHNDRLVIEAKGIYSIEKFLIARRLMYWQVYLHKTVIAAEYLLMQILKRAKYLCRNGSELFSTPAFNFFLKNEFFLDDFRNDEEVINKFSLLDDFDIIASVKVWQDNSDPVLSKLSKMLINRRFFKIEMQNEPFNKTYIENIKKAASHFMRSNEHETDYFVFQDVTTNYAYDPYNANINILFRDGSVKDIADASDMLDISMISRPVTKYFLCYPKGLPSVDK